MLDPFFFQLPPDFEAPTPESGMSVKVIGYAQSNEYTLVTLSYGDEIEWSTIECLYRGRLAIASGSGAIALGVDRGEVAGRSSKSIAPTLSQIQSDLAGTSNPWGIPLADALKLTSPGSYISFIP
jgi:hypothetical protein